jgi:hypothetical protein
MSGTIFQAKAHMLIPVAPRSKAWVCGHSLVGSEGSYLDGGHRCLFPVSVVCCQVEVSSTG